MNETVSNEVSGTAQKPNLNVADILNVLTLIKTCSSRGAFQAEELSSVGALFDRLHSFCIATGAIKPELKPDTNQK